MTPVVSPHLWVSKQTTVTTTDNLRGTTSKIIYNYVPNTAGFGVPNLNSNTNYFVSAVAVESTTSYYGYSPSYPLLRTETKAWSDQFELACDLSTLNDGSGQISGVFYGYSSYGGQIIDKREYDYGQLSSTSSCPGGGTLPTPARETVTTFQTFAATPIYPNGPSIFDRPSSIKIYGNGTLTAETDYSYDQTGVATASTPAGTHDDTNYGASSTSPRGNATTIIKQCIQTCTNPVTTYTYDETGQALSMTDPCGNATCSDMSGTNHTTTYSYVDNYASGTGTPPGQTNAYLTQITYPNTGVAHTESFSWGYNDGQLRSSTDQNSQTTTYTYNTPPSGCSYPDGFDRVSSITYPDTGKTTYCYNDAPYNSSTPSPSVATSKAINSSANLTTLIAFDGLGHVKQTQLTSDPQGTVYADTTYDALGRVWKQSNPYRSGSAPTDGTTTYIYDALGRNCVVVPPDGSAVTNNTCPATHPANDVLTVYVGNTTTVTDQYGIKRQSVTDALGRLTQVFEDPSGLNYETDYAYDALDNLLCTAQKGTNSGTFTNCASIPAAWRPRTFTYDPLSRLLSATNPESGNITYSYDPNGNLATKTAPAPNQTSSATVTTTYSYDALNRLTQKSYSDSPTPAPTPTAYFLYDLVNPWGSTYPNNSYIGRLDETITKNGLGTWLTSSYFLHDPMGRITKIGQCTPTHCSTGFHTVYTYDLIGDLASFRTIENNITFTYGYNAAGRPIKVTSSLADANHPATLATVNASIGYWAFGGLHMLTLGNGLTETAVYNSRLQPCRMNVNSSGAWYNQCTAALASGNVQDFTYGFSLGASDNGNLTSFSASGAGTFNRTYSYGQLNRLSSMSAPGDPSGCTGLSWTYDPWGNRSDQTVTSGTCGTFHTSITTKNQLYDPVHNIYQYDAAGNMTYDGSHTYFYDAENRTIQVGGALGNCSTATACYAYDAQGNRVQKTVGSAVTQYVLDTSGQVIHEADGSGNFATYYIFFGAKLLAQYKNSTTQFIHKDHLGSTRLVTGMTNPSTPVDALDYLPFGEQIAGDTGTTHKFTGKERDSESGNDNFGARYSSSSLGRFMSPDLANTAGELDEEQAPQSWNAYSYTQNNPVSYVDPDGRDCIFTQGDSAYVARDNCSNLPKGAENATYVAGTIDTKSATYDWRTGTLSFSYTPYSTEAGGSGASIGRGSISGLYGPSGVSDADRLESLVHAGYMAEAGVNWALRTTVSNALGAVGGRALEFGVEALLATRAAGAAVDLLNLSPKILRQMVSRSWTKEAIKDTIKQAIQGGTTHQVPNMLTGGAATEFVNPSNGRFVVVDNATKQVIQVSGPGHLPNHLVR